MAVPFPLTESFVDAARAEHPEIEVSLSGFAAHLEGLGVRCDTLALAADLYLAFGCLCGDAAALKTFDTRLLPVVRRVAKRVGGEAMGDDIGQQVASHLLVNTTARPPAIGSYAGRGKLSSWIAVVSTRAATRVLRREGRRVAVGGQRLERLGAPDGDLELAHMKARYQTAFAVAFQNALDSLTVRNRLVLRHHVIDRLSIDAIAQLRGVHRATAARWIQTARQQLLERTRARLMRTEGLTASEYESVTRLIRSQLDLSLQRRLGDVAE
jgi:RNA polymerase sigma-70 factor (ECF subfamily)